jgi:hypothetical protein
VQAVWGRVWTAIDGNTAEGVAEMKNTQQLTEASKAKI